VAGARGRDTMRGAALADIIEQARYREAALLQGAEGD
jgi:hypothetical protein